MSNKFFTVLAVLGCIATGAPTKVLIKEEVGVTATEAVAPSFENLVNTARRIADYKPEALERFDMLVESLEALGNPKRNARQVQFGLLINLPNARTPSSDRPMIYTDSNFSGSSLQQNPEHFCYAAAGVLAGFLITEFPELHTSTENMGYLRATNFLVLEPANLAEEGTPYENRFGGTSITKRVYMYKGDSIKGLIGDPLTLILEIRDLIELQTAKANGTFVMDLPWPELDLVMSHAHYIEPAGNEQIGEIYRAARIAMTNSSKMQPPRNTDYRLVFWANHPHAKNILAAVFHGALKEQGIVPPELEQTFARRPNSVFGSNCITYFTDNDICTPGTRLEFLANGYLDLDLKIYPSSGCWDDLLLYSQLISPSVE